MHYECATCHDTGYKQIDPHARLYCERCWRGELNRTNDLIGTTCRACKDTGYYATAPNVFKLCDCRTGELRRGKTTTAPLCSKCKGWGTHLVSSNLPEYCDCPAGQSRRQWDLKIGATVPATPTPPTRHELTADEETALDTAWARALGWVQP